MNANRRSPEPPLQVSFPGRRRPSGLECHGATSRRIWVWHRGALVFPGVSRRPVWWRWISCRRLRPQDGGRRGDATTKRGLRGWGRTRRRRERRGLEIVASSRFSLSDIFSIGVGNGTTVRKYQVLGDVRGGYWVEGGGRKPALSAIRSQGGEIVRGYSPRPANRSAIPTAGERVAEVGPLRSG
jgi:hypothetical protein